MGNTSLRLNICAFKVRFMVCQPSQRLGIHYRSLVYGYTQPEQCCCFVLAIKPNAIEMYM